MRVLALLTTLALLSPAAVFAGDAEAEIDYLITSVGESGPSRRSEEAATSRSTETSVSAFLEAFI